MDKEKLKKYSWIAILVLAVILISITYCFMLYRNQDLGLILNKVLNIIQPLTIGAVIAYIMKSTCNFFDRILTKWFMKPEKRDPKKTAKVINAVSVILAYIVWLTAIFLLLWIAIPQIIQSVITFIKNMQVMFPTYVNYVVEWERTFLADSDMLRPLFDRLVEGTIKWAETDLVAIITDFAKTRLLPGIITFIGSLVDIVIGLVISVFILLGRKTLAKKSVLFLHCIFKKDSTVKAIVAEFKYADRMFSGFLEGKVIDSTIIGLIYYIVLEILHIQYAPLIAVICGVTNIIPIFGPFIGAIPSAFIILTCEPIKVIPFIIFVFIIQFVDGYIIDPHIVGGNIKLSSFCVVFAVLLFGGLWGFVGLLVGVPTFAVIYDIFKKLSLHILKSRGKQDLIDKFYAEHGKKKKKKKSPQVAVAGAQPAENTAATAESDINKSSAEASEQNEADKKDNANV